MDCTHKLFQLAKKLREAGALPELDWESEEMLATDVGEKVTLENGETVWLDIPYLIEDDDVNDSGMIGEPDAYYDAEERKEAYDQLQDALDHVRNSYEHEMVEQGICPNCAGSGYPEADYEEEEELFENDSDLDDFDLAQADHVQDVGRKEK